MPFEKLLDEVEQLHGVSTRVEGLAGSNPLIGRELLAVAANVRNTATILAVLVATKLQTRPEPI